MSSIVPSPEQGNPPESDADDWSDAPHRVDNARFTYRGRHHYQVSIKTDAHRVTVSISPQGRSVRVWLDGIPMCEEPEPIRDSAEWSVRD